MVCALGTFINRVPTRCAVVRMRERDVVVSRGVRGLTAILVIHIRDVHVKDFLSLTGAYLDYALTSGSLADKISYLYLPVIRITPRNIWFI